jgi:hypothetical protein
LSKVSGVEHPASMHRLHARPRRLQAMSSLPAFSLRDIQGREHSFPTGRPALLCFVREDCPTYGLTMPLIDAAYRAFGAAVNVWSVGQEGNEILVDRRKLSAPMLDDTAVKTSFAYNLELVRQ